jgi:hypothetical protein
VTAVSKTFPLTGCLFSGEMLKVASKVFDSRPVFPGD